MNIKCKQQGGLSETQVFGFSSVGSVNTTPLLGFQVLINRDKISTVGLPATADLLLKLQVYKATADAAGGTAFYKSLTEVKDQWMAWRDVVMARKQPRPVYVQPHLTLDKSTNK